MAEVTGVPETIRALDALTEDVAHMDDTLRNLGARGVAILRPLIPVATGALRRSAAADITRGTALITVGNADVEYAGAVDARVHYTARAEPAITALAVHELEDGITETIKKRGLQ